MEELIMKGQRIFIISFTQIHRTPRVYRQIVFLKELYKLVVAGYGTFHEDGVEFCQLDEPHPKNAIDRVITRASRVFRLKTKRFEEYYWSQPNVQNAFKKLQGETFDLIIAHDLYTLPLSVQLAKKTGAKVLVDLHEYEPRHLDHLWRFRFMYYEYWDYICRTYLPQANSRITVSQGIADEYTRVYGVSCQVVNNAPFYKNLIPTPIQPERIRLIHHGSPHPARKQENMIALMELLDKRFYLDFMLFVNAPRYKPYLRKLQSLAKQNHRIQFRDPVPMPEISQTINDYDIGLYLMWPGPFNNLMALPNKLFEFIQGRLALAIWPLPEMARMTREYNFGVIANDFTVEAMADKLNKLSIEQIQHYKNQSHETAHILSADTNRQIFLELVMKLI
ncbi:MAG: glycosyltransferase family 4 protein [bacterium]|nr:glycosyltransferase family 4 protein [bacterium]